MLIFHIYYKFSDVPVPSNGINLFTTLSCATSSALNIIYDVFILFSTSSSTSSCDACSAKLIH